MLDRGQSPGALASNLAAREAADQQRCMYETAWQADTPGTVAARPAPSGGLQRLAAARMVFADPRGRLLNDLKTHLRRPVRSVAQATARLCDQQATALQRNLPNMQPGATVCLITRGTIADAAALSAGIAGRAAALLAAGSSLSAMHRVAAAENPSLRWVKLGAAAGTASASAQPLAHGVPPAELLDRAAAAGGHGVSLTANVWTTPKLVSRPHAAPSSRAPPSMMLAPKQLQSVLITGKPEAPQHVLRLWIEAAAWPCAVAGVVRVNNILLVGD